MFAAPSLSTVCMYAIVSAILYLHQYNFNNTIPEPPLPLAPLALTFSLIRPRTTTASSIRSSLFARISILSPSPPAPPAPPPPAPPVFHQHVIYKPFRLHRRHRRHHIEYLLKIPMLLSRFLTCTTTPISVLSGWFAFVCPFNRCVPPFSPTGVLLIYLYRSILRYALRNLQAPLQPQFGKSPLRLLATVAFPIGAPITNFRSV